jgi:two-component system, OmpR family, phosphate regulon sensor histidine kinase PhoR
MLWDNHPTLKFRAPANVLLRRAQLTLILAVLLPTILSAPVGIFLLVMHSSRGAMIGAGILVLAFCTSSLTGYILGSILVSRGASLAKVQNDFLSSVSHELTTPITSVRMFIDTLRQERVSDPAEKARCLEIIDREMARLDVLVGKLVALSRLEAGRQPFERKPIAVVDIVEEALAAFEVTRVGAAVDLTVELEPDLHVVGDRPQLVQVLSNLLANAWKYTPGGDQRITVRARALPRRRVALEVADNGPGIPDADRQRIFVEFERGRAAAESRAAGFGLGLAIVRAIVRAHSGRVDLLNNPGGGALFRVTLPRGPREAAEHRAVEAPAR